ncbi:unnamed protein product, partial [Hapterophycus canaliculatus]
NAALTTPDFDVDGAGFGVLAGYKWQRVRVVYGAEIDIASLDVEGTFLRSPCIASASPRVGYTYGNGLYFAALGGAQVSGSAALFSADDFERSAVIFGFGGEWALQDDWSMRIDASFADFDTKPLDVLGGTDLNIGLINMR